MRRVRLCLLGCGAAARAHSRTARSLGGVELVYASRSLAKAEDYRRRFGGVAAFGTYEAACTDERVNAVVVCTPPALHVEHARLAAFGGKAVLIEKPVTRTLAELAEIEAAVAASATLAMVAENYYFKPAVQVLRRHIDRGDLGEVLFIELNRVGRHRPTGWRADEALMGGGALLEGGIHWINFLSRLGGPVREVCALRPDFDRELAAPLEDGLELLVRFETGSVGKLLYAWSGTNRKAGLGLSKIYGTEGNITFESNGLVALATGRRTRLHFPGMRDLMGSRAMLRHFIACVRESRVPEMSLAVARRDLGVVDAAYRSLGSRCFERPLQRTDSTPPKALAGGARYRAPED